MLVAGERDRLRSTDLRAGVVTQHHVNIGGLCRDIGDGHAEDNAAGIIVSQQIGACVAGLERNHGFLRRWNLMEDGEAVNGARGS